jgi:hypothetical protein
MNNGPSHPSPTIRAFTDERFLAAYRAILMAFVGISMFFGQRMVNSIDESARQINDLKREMAQRVEDGASRLAEFKIEVARTNATTVATMLAIQNRVDAQSRRMDISDGDIREINKKLYDGRLLK